MEKHHVRAGGSISSMVLGMSMAESNEEDNIQNDYFVGKEEENERSHIKEKEEIGAARPKRIEQRKSMIKPIFSELR